jgi:tight adherence protein C
MLIPVLGAFFLTLLIFAIALGWLFLHRSRWKELARHLNDDLAGFFFPRGDADSLRKRLFQAGYRSPDALGAYLLVRYATGGVVLFLLAPYSLFGALSAAAAITMLPRRILSYRLKARAAAIRNALPPALDLIVLSLEAGHSLDYALVHSAAALKPLHPELSAEFALCNAEVRAGTSRSEAIRRLGERVPDDELRKLVAVILDAERFGTSVATALRSHTHYLRQRMRQHAQEYARKLSVRLVFPIFFLIFPSILLITLGPAYLQLQGMLTTLSR